MLRDLQQLKVAQNVDPVAAIGRQEGGHGEPMQQPMRKVFQSKTNGPCTGWILDMTFSRTLGTCETVSWMMGLLRCTVFWTVHGISISTVWIRYYTKVSTCCRQILGISVIFSLDGHSGQKQKNISISKGKGKSTSCSEGRKASVSSLWM